MQPTIKAFIKRPNRKPEQITLKPTRAALAAAVGGDIEALSITTDTALVCDTGARQKGLDFCLNYGGDLAVFGPAVFVGFENGELADFPAATVREFEHKVDIYY